MLLPAAGHSQPLDASLVVLLLVDRHDRCAAVVIDNETHDAEQAFAMGPDAIFVRG